MHSLPWWSGKHVNKRFHWLKHIIKHWLKEEILCKCMKTPPVLSYWRVEVYENSTCIIILTSGSVWKLHPSYHTDEWKCMKTSPVLSYWLVEVYENSTHPILLASGRVWKLHPSYDTGKWILLHRKKSTMPCYMHRQ